MANLITCLARGTRVRFVARDGLPMVGYVGSRHLNPSRRPGVGRVSYDVWVELDGRKSGFLIVMKASKLEVAS